MTIRVFMDSNSTAIYIDDKLIEHDLHVLAAWLLGKFQKYDIIPYADKIEILVRKYKDWDKLPNSHDFIQKDMKFDENFIINGLDIDSIQLKDYSFPNPPKQFKTLQKFLKKKFDILI